MVWSSFLELASFFRGVAAYTLSRHGVHFGFYVGWLTLVVCLPHRLCILSDISNHLAKISADWYYSSRTDSSCLDNELEPRLLKSENHFHAKHLLPRAVDKLTDDHVATIYEAVPDFFSTYLSRCFYGREKITQKSMLVSTYYYEMERKENHSCTIHFWTIW
jgi:hypothetical protein